MFQQAWCDRRPNFNATQPINRTLTPKRLTQTREEFDRTPERVHTEYANQMTSYSPAPNFQQKKGYGMGSTFSAKQQNIYQESERSKSPKFIKSQHQTVRASCGNLGNLTNQLKAKNLNLEGLSPNSKSNSQSYNPSSTQQISPNIIKNNENNYLNQINKLMQKITKLKKDVEIYQERETQYIGKVQTLEKENTSLQALIEEKDQKIGEIMKKSKEDKLKMYTFITEFENYKESVERERTKSESTVKLYEAESTKSKDSQSKALMVDRCIQIQTEDDNSCQNCYNVQEQCKVLSQKLNETTQIAQTLVQEYDVLKAQLEDSQKGGQNHQKVCAEYEQKYTELQKNFQHQTSLCSQIIAENSLVRLSLSQMSEQRIQQIADNHKNKMQKKQTMDEPIPSCLKALGIAERIGQAGQ